MPKRKLPLQSARNICFATKESGKHLQVQMSHVKRAVHRSIILTMVSSITFLLSLAIVTGVIGAAGKLAMVGTFMLLVASVAAAFEARVLFKAIAEEHRVDNLKSEFISLASHQLRTPLSSLEWYIELINDKNNLNTEQQEYVKEMDVAAKRMSNLIDALLHAARLEGGDITPHKNTVELTSLVTDLGDELRSMGKKKKIATKVFVPKQKIEMETDSVLLHVIFKNLFSNAVKYTPEGGDVSVSMEATKTAVYIEVSDNGIGIPKVAQKRLFQRLFRASNVLKMDTDGNGLGLYITNMVVDSLGGKISVESTEGKGSTFIVTLPIKKTKAVKPKKKKK
ncbi:MAG: HAMP domain-containing sensor histidine kinase [Candidatus Peribacteraceae bacterium]|jgi:signal transduction histidine kinase|nr:HAMP domain-containing sensor histidine kinase [Candidatus Peribacteraceae bacterium]|tara:strand:+ start:377 stop:1390 length:1014 start_codon:yes stop_codon:yes gene_type:complete